jgi:hypothetical protein
MQEEQDLKPFLSRQRRKSVAMKGGLPGQELVQTQQSELQQLAGLCNSVPICALVN